MNLTMLPFLPLPTRGDGLPRSIVPESTRSPATDLASHPGGAWRVRADVTIPALTTAGPYPSEVLVGINTLDNPKPTKTVQVKVKDGFLAAVCGPEPPCHWLLCVTPARDRHEQNMEALRDARGMIFFRAIKEIRRGEELLVWYSAELAMECGIPILTPGNIRSDQEYACTSCDATFRYPNTLKAHIRFHCTRNPMTSWLGQYPVLQPGAGSLLSAYQQELSKYFSHLGTLWNLRKMATSGGETAARPPPPSNISPPPPATADTKSAFRPLTSSHSQIFTPTQIPIGAPRNKMTHEKSVESRSPLPEEPKKSRDSLRRMDEKTAPAGGSYRGNPNIPSYLDKVYMYNYANYLRSDLSTAFPTDLSRSMQRIPHFNGPMDYPNSTSPQESLLRARALSAASSVGFPEAMSRREENRSPDSDRDSSPKMPLPTINFPLPSEAAGEPIDLLPKSLYMSKAYKGHLCIYCGKLYSRKYGLKIHLRTHTGYKPLKCKVCLRPFGDPSNLNKHIRLHAEGETPYRCDFCGKVLVRRRDLERHVKSRHPNESMRCLDVIGDDKSDKLCDTDNSFIDVDDEDEDDVLDTPLDMSRQEIDVT